VAVNLADTTADLPPVRGVALGTAAAIRKNKKNKPRDDLTLISLCAGSRLAAVFTRNRYAAPPVVVCREHLSEAGQCSRQQTPPGMRALAINAGIANAGTAGGGLADARESCRAAASLLGCAPSQVLPFSTGVIMERLPMARYKAGLKQCAKNLAADNWPAAARAIMTTDTLPKGAHQKTEIDGVGVGITGVAKGSGMIHPQMATMLAFVATDAYIPQTMLAREWKRICADTFNAISVDGDTSTNDAAVLIATGAAGVHIGGKTAGGARKNREKLFRAIYQTASKLADAIVRDGEGATKIAVIRVGGAPSAVTARAVADAVATSPLVKTALYAADANVGRLLMAIGKARAAFEPAEVDVRLGGAPVIRGGAIAPQYKEARAAAHLAGDEILIEIFLNQGRHTAALTTCDLSPRYIEINAAYRS
jgi:glutamate N-acetyltransferase/amino-acid N-acetyltransferase